MVAHAKAELGRIDTLKTLSVAEASFLEAFNGLLDSAGDAIIESSHVGQGRRNPCDLHYSNPSLRIASAWEMALPPFCSSQVFASVGACSVIDSGEAAFGRIEAVAQNHAFVDRAEVVVRVFVKPAGDCKRKPKINL